MIMKKSCETCIHSYRLYEYNPDGVLIPESEYYLCKINDEEYFAENTPISCKHYLMTAFFQGYIG